MSTREAFIAANRFGLGARPGELDRAAGDPRGWLKGQLSGGRIEAFPGLPSSESIVAEFIEARRMGGPLAKKAARRKARELYIKEISARLRRQAETANAFHERWVLFWSNHFTVSVRKGRILGLAGAFEREAIRPYATRRFADMLGAVLRHPAMLIYLDNARSMGPHSRVGRRRGKGLNENLAREVLELHTLGVDGGYTQADVREFARILTGWSIAGPRQERPGTFRFHEPLHEPGAKTLLGRRYGEDGIGEGEAALEALARHPSTARHIARKLARHFVADDPPERVVDRLAGVFGETEGDLGALASALVETPEAWADPLAKVKSANDYVVSALRALAFQGEPRRAIASLRILGQVPFAAPSPQGWPDTAEKWIGPEAIMRRAEWAMALARRAGRSLAPKDLLADTIGPVAGGDTTLAVERASSVTEAVALVIASPEFQRR